MIFDTMKKAGIMMAVALLSMTPMAAQNAKLMKSNTQKVMFNGQEVSRINKSQNGFTMQGAQQSIKPVKRSVINKSGEMITEFVLINEDFNKMTAGTEQVPDKKNRLVSLCGDGPTEIDPSLTNESGWWGDNAFQAGGALALYQRNAQLSGCVNTPMGDYSGDIKITLRCKATDDTKNSSLLFINILKGVDNPDFADCDKPYQMVTLYPGKDWAKLTITARNLSADNDGYIQFNCYGGVLIDDIEITSQPNFIAAPKVKPLTNFKATEFTANWEPVNLAYNYYLNLYKKEYTSDSGLDMAIDFEDGLMPESWSTDPAGGAAVCDGEGVDNSKALKFFPGQTVYTTDVKAPYNSAEFYFKLVLPKDLTEEEIASVTNMAQFNIQAKNNGVWENLGTFQAGYMTGGYNINMDEACMYGFAGKYSSLQFSISNVPEGTYAVIDNFTFTTARPFELTPIYAEDKGRKGYYYDTTQETSYTFTDLDPLSEYYYNVRSHYQSLFSDETILNYAFGIASPELLPATDIDQRGGYTANWGAAPKATRYVVTNYGVTSVESDVRQTILEENFSKVDASVTSATDPLAGEDIGNNMPSSLDAYTQMPGWEGRGNLLAQGFMGCDNMDWNICYIQTPPLYLTNNKEFYLTINAKGMAGSSLVVYDGTKQMYIDFEKAGNGATGFINGTYLADVSTDIEKLLIYDANGVPFAIDYILIEQDLKAGDKVFTMVDKQEVDSDELSYRFTDLDQYDFTNFAYNVVSCFDQGINTATSDPTDYMIVDLINGTSTTGVSSTGLQSTQQGANGEVARYNVSGSRINTPVKGLNIIRCADGSVKKVMVK